MKQDTFLASRLASISSCQISDGVKLIAQELAVMAVISRASHTLVKIETMAARSFRRVSLIFELMMKLMFSTLFSVEFSGIEVVEMLFSDQFSGSLEFSLESGFLPISPIFNQSS
jgi:hypothetical protein